ncbi:MAG: hypothetical protein OXC10_12890 [Rhodospirillaceae bacterium]|nr:hypothetical protein [Rhodospirillaceae bacterium]
MAMKNPVHPGALVREDCLKPLGLSVTEGAKRLGMQLAFDLSRSRDLDRRIKVERIAVA